MTLHRAFSPARSSRLLRSSRRHPAPQLLENLEPRLLLSAAHRAAPLALAAGALHHHVAPNNLALPATLAGLTLTLKVAAGAYPAASTSPYQILFSAKTDQYVVIGSDYVPCSSGHYSYSLTSATTATISLTDNRAGDCTLILSALNKSTAAYSFIRGNSATVGEESGTARFSTTPAPANAFAPADLIARTFNANITSGTNGFPHAGSFALTFSPSDDTYMLTGSGLVPSGSGHYDYTQFSPTTALITYDNDTLGPGEMVLNFKSPYSLTFTASNSTDGVAAGTMTLDHLYSPATLNGQQLAVHFASGSDAGDSLQLFTSPDDSTDLALNDKKNGGDFGTFSFTRTGTYTGTLTLVDYNHTGTAALTFSSPTNATFIYYADGSNAPQTGTIHFSTPNAPLYSPLALNSSILDASIARSSGGYAHNGKFQLFLSDSRSTGSPMVLLGNSPKVPTSGGSASYHQFSSNVGYITFDDNSLGGDGVLLLTFTSPTTATYTLINQNAAFQRGKITIEATPLQATAPETLTDSLLNLAPSNTTLPFPAAPTATLSFAGSTYALNFSGVSTTTGSYTYERYSPSTGVVTFSDPTYGNDFAILNFTSATTGTYLLIDPFNGGTQTGTFAEATAMPL